jgi:hypothetical protein
MAKSTEEPVVKSISAGEYIVVRVRQLSYAEAGAV